MVHLCGQTSMRPMNVVGQRLYPQTIQVPEDVLRIRPVARRCIRQLQAIAFEADELLRRPSTNRFAS